MNHVVIVSGGQQRDSAIHIHASTLPQTPLPSRLPNNIEQRSLCCTAGPCWLFILNIADCYHPCKWGGGRKWGILSKGKKSKTNKQTNTKQKQKILGRTWEPGFWQGLKQAVSNTIILKGETITTCPFAVYAFTNRAFQRIRPPESCPLDKMCSRAASDKLQRETNRCDYGPWHLARTLTVS